MKRKYSDDEVLAEMRRVSEEKEQLIQELKEATAQRWIPVAERFPEAKEDVLICTRFGWILIAWYGPNGQSWHVIPAGTTLDDIIAWMPLPEPYRP